MRILYVIAALQHPRIRGATRHYFFPRELAKRHEITLLSLVRSNVEPTALDDIRSFTRDLHVFNINGECNSRLAGAAAKMPFCGNYFEKNIKLAHGVQRMKDTFRDLVSHQQFDLVLFHGKSIFPVIEDWQGLPIVTDFCDATSLRIRTSMRYNGIAKVPYYFCKWLSTRKIERKMVHKTPHVAFISSRDRAAVMGAKDRSAIVPLGVDHEFWRRRTSEHDPTCLVFTGVMDYSPNHDAAIYLIDKILPALRQRMPDLKLLIVGRNPKPELKQKAKAHPEVTVTGFVDDVRPYLERATVFVAPIRYASGSQNKVLEAMSMKVPVVATPVVSDGLMIDEYGEPPLLSAGDEQQFIESVIRMLENGQERDRLAEEGRQFVEKYFDWTSSARKLEQICQEAVGHS